MLLLGAEGELRGLSVTSQGWQQSFALATDGSTPVALAQSGPFVFVASAGSAGISAYRLDSPSAPRILGAMDGEIGPGIQDPVALGVLTAAGLRYLLVAASGSSSISSLRIGGDGHLRVADHILDTTHTRFGRVQDMATVQVGEQGLVFVSGGDDGLAMFTLLPGGRLLQLDTLVSAAGRMQDGPGAITAKVVGQEIQIFLATGAAAGLVQLRVELSDLRPVQSLTAAGRLQARAAQGEILQGSSGADRLIGGAGDDILLTGGGRDVLSGGSGRDLFISTRGSAASRITDFTPGTDRLDLSDWPMLYDLSQLGHRPLGWGARLTWRGESLDVYRAGGGAISRAEIIAAVQPAPHRPYVDPPGRTTGTAGDDYLRATFGAVRLLGQAGNDTLQGSGVGDTLEGGAGNDEILAGGGNDLVYGGTGRDYVTLGYGDDRYSDAPEMGPAGADTIYGGAGRDHIHSGAGPDLIYGDPGNDTLYGAEGHDQIHGEEGDDVLWGGRGYDSIRAGAGNDRVNGGEHADLVWLGAGNDIYDDTPDQGPAHADTIHGEDGHDRIHGGGGPDRIYGGSGIDTLWGGNGHDLVDGGSEVDFIYGGLGLDRLYGGSGNDRVYGGIARDIAWLGSGSDYYEDTTEQGAAGSDTVYGEEGHDRIHGGGGPDLLYGGAGNDAILGEMGHDSLYGGGGQDLLWGGIGADVFIFAGGESGRAVIGDFTPGLDRIGLDDALWAGNRSPAQLLQQGLRPVKEGLMLTIGAQTILLLDLKPGEFTAGDLWIF